MNRSPDLVEKLNFSHQVHYATWQLRLTGRVPMIRRDAGLMIAQEQMAIRLNRYTDSITYGVWALLWGGLPNSPKNQSIFETFMICTAPIDTSPELTP